MLRPSVRLAQRPDGDQKEGPRLMNLQLAAPGPTGVLLRRIVSPCQGLSTLSADRGTFAPGNAKPMQGDLQESRSAVKRK
jgi:hypothetical protein